MYLLHLGTLLELKKAQDKVDEEYPMPEGAEGKSPKVNRQTMFSL